MTEAGDRSRSEWLGQLIEVAGAQTVSDAVGRAFDGVERLLGFDRVAVLRFDGETLDVVAATIDVELEHQRRLDADLIEALRSPGPIADRALLGDLDAAVAGALPILANGVVWGVLVIGYSMDHADDATALTGSNLESLASTLGMVIGRDEIQQRLEESNRRLEAYAHAAAHDLRSPLRRIRSFAQLLQARLQVEEIDREQLSDFADRIANGAERLDALLGSMLEHASMNTLAGESHEYTDLQVIANRICAGITELSLEPRPTFEVTDLPEIRLPADAAERVLRNLIDNALKYSPPDRAAIIKISSTPSDQGVRVKVSDNGEGIDPQFASQVFQQFNRLNNEEAGTGVGLTMVEQLLASRGAKIWLEPGTETGATFVMEFPISAVRPALVGRVPPAATQSLDDQAASA